MALELNLKRSVKVNTPADGEIIVTLQGGARMPPPRLPWQDRWNQPTVEQLLAPFKSETDQPLTRLVSKLDALDHAERAITWYGPAWRWTMHYSVADPDGVADADANTLAYLVPNNKTPAVSVPLHPDLIGQLPLKRMTKYVREGIRIAKCAVEIHWATWTPTNDSDADALADLLKHKHKLLYQRNTGKTPGKKTAAKR